MDDRMISPEAESALIGGLLFSPVDLDAAMALVRADDFAVEFNRRAFAAILKLAADRTAIDLLTVAEKLESTSGLSADEFAGLAVLARDTPSAANVLAYARMVRNQAIRRRLLVAAADISRVAEKYPDAEIGLARAKTILEVVDSDRPATATRYIADILPAVVADLDERANRTARLLGLSCGLPDVDSILDGLCPGRLYVVAGRPGSGKSIFGLQACCAAVSAGKRAVLFSLEMPAAEIAHRLLAAEIPIPLGRLQAARLTEGDWTNVVATADRLSPLPLYVDDASQTSIGDLQAIVRRLHRISPLSLVVVDYVGLVDGTPESRHNRVLEIGSISRGLKQLAKDLNLAVIAIAQLNRSLEQRGDKRPILSDLRESGNLEQDADVVAFVYRDELHNENSPDAGCAEFLIRKNRSGPTGMVPLRFDGQHCRFQSLAGGLPSRELPPPVAVSRRRGIDL